LIDIATLRIQGQSNSDLERKGAGQELRRREVD
jgi:hypothetical protein